MSKWQRGDTIIEAMIAFTVFAMIAVAALAIMNRGTASAQDALETTLVRQQIDNQAEQLRYLHQAYSQSPTADGQSAVFRDLISESQTRASPSEFGSETCNAVPDSAFALYPTTSSTIQKIQTQNLRSYTDDNAPPFAQVSGTETVTSYGLWVESVRASSNDYVDFHIRACWNAASGSNVRTIGTIVRLFVGNAS